jgi:peptidyl-prolyl cis-trans isomerase B (cyclophilin B)
MMQGGNGEPVGKDCDTIKGEFAANGVDNPLTHVRGAISMARTPVYDSASSQFFIVHEDSTFLDGQYAAFGYVTAGLNIVDAVCTAAKPIDGNGGIAEADQPVIVTVKIREVK